MVANVRRSVQVRRAGHAGTLDPFATGLLIVLLGRATRLARFLADLPKQYTGVITLGQVTDTDDRTGRVCETSETWRDMDDAALRAALLSLTGRYEQRPPPFSAKKRGGERAYRLARRGEPVELTPQTVVVRRFDLIGRTGARLDFATEVSSGTYVRALARDLGARLGCGAHLKELRRTAIGPFTVDEALPLAALEAGAPPPRPPIDAVAHLPRLELDEATRTLVAHGRSIPAPAQADGPVALTADGALLAVAEPADGQLKPRVVLAG